jgi:hypothetical protein
MPLGGPLAFGRAGAGKDPLDRALGRNRRD